MRNTPSDIAFTDTVKAQQAEHGSRDAYARMEAGRGWQTTVTPELALFLSDLDMFYLATANADGQPYIQYRGGAPGFLRVIDDTTLGFCDFEGNRQYITAGNLVDNERAFIFLIDYVNRRRIKLWGTARVVADDPELIEQLRDSEYQGLAARAIIFNVEAWDANCPKHIHQRLPLAQVEPAMDALRNRINDLERQLAHAQSAN